MAKKGRRTAVIERKYIGGSCPNVVCLPSKNIIHARIRGRSWKNDREQTRAEPRGKPWRDQRFAVVAVRAPRPWPGAAGRKAAGTIRVRGQTDQHKVGGSELKALFGGQRYFRIGRNSGPTHFLRRWSCAADRCETGLEGSAATNC
jgi:hypothetical protein